MVFGVSDYFILPNNSGHPFRQNCAWNGMSAYYLIIMLAYADITRRKTFTTTFLGRPNELHTIQLYKEKLK
jgi:hypothetical protein